jgi:3-oxoacyl-[acyl-carrier-protein] synthase-3
LKKKAYISAISHWAPDRILSNSDLEKMVATSDEWIVSRTGIKERRILDKDKPTSYLGIQAAKRLLEQNNIDAAEIDAIIVPTITPDMFFPTTANIIQEAIGARKAFSFDLAAACSGFIYGLAVGAQFIETGAYKKILVIGADKMSSITDYSDRATCILFGDAAGAVLLEPTEDPAIGLIDYTLHADGSGADYLYLKGGGSLYPPTEETVAKKMHYLYQDGKAVFKFAVQGMADVAIYLLERNGLTGDDVDILVPHQANLRIIDATVRRLGIPKEKCLVNIDRYGNTTAATIPMALSEAYQEGKVNKGDLILLTTFGAGFTWGSALLRWGLGKPANVYHEIGER